MGWPAQRRLLMRFLLLLAISACSTASAGQHIRVHDGDTFTLDGTRWRLWGVDAPELDQTCAGSPCGVQAREELRSLIACHSVTCQPRGRSYDRTVGVCTAGGLDLGAEMVRSGCALDYRRYSGGAYAGQESEARRKTIGIWTSTFTAPWLYRLTMARGR